MALRRGGEAYDDRLVPLEVWQSKKREQREAAQGGDYDPDEQPLSPIEQEEYAIIRRCNSLYQDARQARQPFETFDICWDLFIGNVWPRSWPSWRATITVNKIRSYITFMQAIMTDNKPRYHVDPRVPGSEDAADLLTKLVDRDWDENNMQHKLSIFCLYGLLWGTGFMKMGYDPYANGGRGKHTAAPVVPYRIYTNRTATSREDAELLIHVEDQTLGWIERNYPTKAADCYRIKGARTTEEREIDRDFVREGDMPSRLRVVSAQNINGVIQPPQYSSPNPRDGDMARDTVEIQEYWLKDNTLEEYQRQKIVNGKYITKPVVKSDETYDLQVTGHKTVPSPIDGSPFSMPVRTPKQEPVMESAQRLKYPNGRLVIIAGGRVLLCDIPNPYTIDDVFPFAMWKDYEVGNFWGLGEPLALKDCQIASNKILSQLAEILEKTGNPQLKVKKTGGVNTQKISNKPGLIVMMDEMDAVAPLEKAGIPGDFYKLFEMIQKGMSDISGVTDAVMGAMPGGNTSFGTIDQLQESGAAVIRLKVRNFETGITCIGKLRIQLIQQFDNGATPLRQTREESEKDKGVVPAASDFNVQFKSYKKANLQGQVEFGVVPISSLSTSPAGTWNRWMALLEKGLIDEIWWHSKFRIEGWRTQLARMLDARKQAAAAEASLKRASKVKPGPSQQSGSGRETVRRRQAPQSFVPTAAQNAAVR